MGSVGKENTIAHMTAQIFFPEKPKRTIQGLKIQCSNPRQGTRHGLYTQDLALHTPWGYTVSMQEEIKTSITNRLRRVEGQVRGLQKMVDEEKYCIDVITQSSAIRSALSAVEDLMLENHLSEHVIHQMKEGQERKAIGEIISIFKKAKKK